MNKIWMRIVTSAILCGIAVATYGAQSPDPGAGAASFAVSFPAARSAAPLDGRVILLLSRDLTREPRTHVSPDEPLATPYLFGVNVDALAPGRAVVLDDSAFGWPADRLAHVPTGDYL